MFEINKILDISNIRLYKLLEISQYTILFFTVTSIVSYLLNTYVFTETNEEIKKMSKIRLIVSLLIQLIILTIAFFYIRKLALLVPSLGNLLDQNFRPHTTNEYTIHIALVFVFLEVTKHLKLKLDLFKEILQSE